MYLHGSMIENLLMMSSPLDDETINFSWIKWCFTVDCTQNSEVDKWLTRTAVCNVDNNSNNSVARTHMTDLFWKEPKPTVCFGDISMLFSCVFPRENSNIAWKRSLKIIFQYLSIQKIVWYWRKTMFRYMKSDTISGNTVYVYILCMGVYN